MAPLKNKPRFLIIRFSSLGDIVLTTPFILYLKKKYPDADFFYLTKKKFLQLIEHFPCTVKPIFLEDFKSLFELRSYIQHHCFDSVYDLHNNLRSNFLLRLSHVNYSIYKKRHYYRKFKTLFHIKKLDLSTVKQYFTCLTSQVPDPIPLPALKTNTNKLKKKSKFKLGIHPGASRKTKQWPTEYLILLLSKLKEIPDIQADIIGGESESEILNQFKKSDIHTIGPGLTISELINCISEYDLFLSNDSGPAHIADALNIPVITIFGATHPGLGFAPYRDSATILTNNQICSPCTLHGDSKCPRGHFKCMKELTPDIILESIINVKKRIAP